jgi:glutamine amidotransferase
VVKAGGVKIAIVDVGLGNLRSVERAIVRAASDSSEANVRVAITSDADEIASADKVVVPGQGAFRDCARALGVGGLGEAIRSSIARGTPYLGICLGLQVLFGSSEEAVGCAGLGALAGDVGRLPDRAPDGERLKIPHIGWNTIDVRPGASALLPTEPTYFYFVHSYAVRPRDPGLVASTTDYGSPFTSAVARDNVLAVQFHPEKSQAAGLALLVRFVRA